MVLPLPAVLDISTVRASVDVAPHNIEADPAAGKIGDRFRGGESRLKNKIVNILLHESRLSQTPAQPVALYRESARDRNPLHRLAASR